MGWSHAAKTQQADGAGSESAGDLTVVSPIGSGLAREDLHGLVQVRDILPAAAPSSPYRRLSLLPQQISCFFVSPLSFPLPAGVLMCRILYVLCRCLLR